MTGWGFFVFFRCQENSAIQETLFAPRQQFAVCKRDYQDSRRVGPNRPQ